MNLCLMERSSIQDMTFTGRTATGGGGVFIPIKSCLISSGITEFDSDCEAVWARIQVL